MPTGKRPTAPVSQPFPRGHLGCTEAQWRAKKRTEWREVMSALRVFRYGAAYVPGNRLRHDIDKLAAEMEVLLEGDWVAW